MSVRRAGARLPYFALLLVILVALSRTALADVVEQGVKDSKPSGLMAGVAKVNINPPFGAPQSSWGSATHIASKAIDPNGMWIRALVLTDGKMKFALVDTDGGGGGEEGIKQASKLTGIPAERIRVGVSHTHSGPGGPRIDLASAGLDMTGIDIDYLKKMMAVYRTSSAEKFVSVIVEANKNLRVNVENHTKASTWTDFDFAIRGEVFLQVLEGLRDTTVGVQFDTANPLVAGEDTVDLFEKVRSRIGYVHINDVARPGVFEFVPVGTGISPIREVLIRLHEQGYAGWIGIEEASRTGKDGFRQAVRHTRRILGES